MPTDGNGPSRPFDPDLAGKLDGFMRDAVARRTPGRARGRRKAKAGSLEAYILDRLREGATRDEAGPSD